MSDFLTLYELNNLVRGVLEQTLSDCFWVQAELSDVRQAYNGHCYMELVQKEGDQMIAKARATIWNATYRQLKPRFEKATGCVLAAGLKVLLQVRVTFHELYGYNLNVLDLDPAYTLGDMALRRQEILAQLQEEGVLHDNKDLKLPLFLNRIAVISSATAAGYGDFCDQLLHNDYGLQFDVTLFPAVMQGDQVESSVLKALDCILKEKDKWDVVVIIRGGGATSDLTGFDTYLLAAACAQFPLPIITGIGHERDDTVIDMVAHTRVKTPTAAAAFLLNHQLEVASRLEEVSQKIRLLLGERMDLEKKRLDRISRRIPLAVQDTWNGQARRLEFVSQRIYNGIRQRVQQQEHHLGMSEQHLKFLLQNRLVKEQHRLALLQQQLRAADPALLLQKGYSMTYVGGKLIRSVHEIQAGDVLETYMEDGVIHSVVRQTVAKNNQENNESLW